MTRSALILVALAGCFDSLVGSPCATGYDVVGGRCVERTAPPDTQPGSDAGPPTDGGPDVSSPDGGPPVDGSGNDGGSSPDAPPVDAGPDALVCTLPALDCGGTCIDVSSDPDHCGTCDRPCASGICTAGHCEGTLSGHIIAIGHDYQSHHAAMRRVLGNSIALGVHTDVGLARYRGTATNASHAGTAQAIATVMALLGRPWHDVPLPAVPSLTTLDPADVLVIEAQTGDGNAAAAAAAPWTAAIDRMLQRGGVVIVLHGAGGVSHRFAGGAALYTVAAPVDATNLPALVSDASDAVAQQVVSPYLAETSSVLFADVTGPVIATPLGATIVFHDTRY